MVPRSGREVSRIEGFSDAVFGFALTLLVVSLEVPDNFDGLKQILRGFIPFAATFALVCWIWFEHYGTSIATAASSGCRTSRRSAPAPARGRTCSA